jgi:hypothetical protein
MFRPPHLDGRDPHAGLAIPLHKGFANHGRLFGPADFKPGARPAVQRRSGEEQGKGEGGLAMRTPAGGEEPGCSGSRGERRGGDHRARGAERIEQGNQHEAAGGGAGEVGEVDRPDPADRFRQRGGKHEAGEREWQRAQRVHDGRWATPGRPAKWTR